MGAKHAPLSERLARMTIRDPKGDCHLFTGTTNPNGYGLINAEPRRNVPAHRAAYEIAVGPIPKGLDIDHLCGVRHCVHPAHLEAVTHQEHTLRSLGPTAINATKGSCPAGHPYDRTNSRGARACRQCLRSAARAARRRKAQERT